MTSIKTLFIATALAGLLAGAATLQAAEAPAAVKTMKPMHGISFDVGSKHAVSYFLADNGYCKLTLMVVDAPEGDDIASSPITRFESSIGSGAAERFDTGEGKSLEFTCQPGAQAMNVVAVDQVAAHADKTN
jgi:hypothetical protein